jgi:hypothetical protein
MTTHHPVIADEVFTAALTTYHRIADEDGFTRAQSSILYFALDAALKVERERLAQAIEAGVCTPHYEGDYGDGNNSALQEAARIVRSGVVK